MAEFSNKLLEEAGLNKNEALIYEKILEHGELTPSKIASLTEISRENTYYIIKSLLSKELIEEIPRRKVKAFRALSPQNLREFLKKQKNDFETKERAIEAIIPQLQSIYNLTTNKPSVSNFEGILGIKKVYEDTLREKPEEVLVFRSIYDDETLGPFIIDHVKKLTLAGIKSRLITPETGTFTNEIDGVKILREVKAITGEIFELPTEVSIYNNKVAIVSLRKDKLGVIIESPDFAETFKKIFNLLWNAY